MLNPIGTYKLGLGQTSGMCPICSRSPIDIDIKCVIKDQMQTNSVPKGLQQWEVDYTPPVTFIILPVHLSCKLMTEIVSLFGSGLLNYPLHFFVQHDPRST